MKLAPYPEYKDAGVAWLGRIPAHWPEKRAKYYFKEIDERSRTGDEEMLSVSHITGVTPRSQKNVTMFQAESNAGQKLCQPGDVVINTMWAWMAALGVSSHAGIVSPSYGVYRPINEDDYDPYYVDHLLRIEGHRSEYICRSTGIRASRLRLYPDRFLSMRLICPPRDEQDAIVRYLKAQNRLSRKFIRNKRRLIELLKEQKQNIINQAVTRGLDPNVKLKPSGVEWIGDIPEYWFCQRLKGLFREIDERSLSGAEQHLSMSQKHGGLVKSSEIEERRLMSESYAGGKLCTSDDIILNRLKAHLGVFALAPCDGVISPDYSVFRGLTEIEPLYFEYLLRSTTIRPELRMRCKGIVEGFWRLYSDDFLALKVPVPPIDEQREIIKEISSCSIAIDKATVRAKDEIDLIREYRARLISDVVTGQVDVRHIAVPEITEQDLTPLDDADADDLLDETLEAEDAA